MRFLWKLSYWVSLGEGTQESIVMRNLMQFYRVSFILIPVLFLQNEYGPVYELFQVQIEFDRKLCLRLMVL